ncbi:uncharacterized protein LOC108258207 isoform X2 [Ictalurus punctatus]|uniref:Uncharacterized protein LOC108258207 isoform X2 n=1 Tax=Ictalurus punctatus TaxID=7998 RepID=A0A9F7QWS9_ICTPU|nr:uncharacterized protein LOC108258207 isoform X2 [Ictalurus punctatus]
MESTEVRPCSSRKPPHTPTPAGSQLCGDMWTEICLASDGGSVEHITPMDLQKYVKKEEIVDEEYLCEGLSDSVGHLTPVDQQNHVKKEEPEDEPNFCDGTSNSMENVDEHSGGFERKPVKKEDEDEDPCTTTDWGSKLIGH